MRSLSIDWPRALPGLLTTGIGILSPTASYTVLKLSPDQRILNAIGDPLTNGVMGLYIQIGTVFVTSLVAFITSLYFFFTARSRFLRILSILIAVFLGIIFLWLFTMGGGASIDLDPYVPKRPRQPGWIDIPPFDSWLTWLRIGLSIVGLVYAGFQVSRNGNERNQVQKNAS